MYKLLNINGVSLPDPEGAFYVNKKDKFNEYQGEDGSITIEVIREGITSCKASYNGLTAEQVTEIKDAIKIVSTVVIYDPTIGSTKEFSAKITDIDVQKKYHKNDVSVWSLSFSIEEL